MYCFGDGWMTGFIKRCLYCIQYSLLHGRTLRQCHVRNNGTVKLILCAKIYTILLKRKKTTFLISRFTLHTPNPSPWKIHIVIKWIQFQQWLKSEIQLILLFIISASQCQHLQPVLLCFAPALWDTTKWLQ